MSTKNVILSACAAASQATQDQQRSLAESANEWMQARSREMCPGVPSPPVTHKLIGMLAQQMNSITSQNKADAQVLDDVWNKSEGDVLRSMVAKPPENALLIGAFRWLGSGFPLVTMGHKYAAALLATAVPKEVHEYIVEPWRAFVILVPNELIHADNGHGQTTEVRSVLVVRLDESSSRKWCYIAMTDSPVLLWRFSPDIADIIKENSEHNAYEGYSFLLDFEDIDDRASALIGRLIANTCLAMTDPNNFSSPRRMSNKARERAKRRSEPVFSTYVLGKQISIDCRQQVAAYSRGERAAPSVQTLVRGHWKRQAFGPGRKDRRLIHIEPYWRGPDDAPINVKNIHLGGKS